MFMPLVARSAGATAQSSAAAIMMLTRRGVADVDMVLRELGTGPLCQIQAGRAAHQQTITMLILPDAHRSYTGIMSALLGETRSECPATVTRNRVSTDSPPWMPGPGRPEPARQLELARWLPGRTHAGPRYGQKCLANLCVTPFRDGEKGGRFRANHRVKWPPYYVSVTMRRRMPSIGPATDGRYFGRRIKLPMAGQQYHQKEQFRPAGAGRWSRRRHIRPRRESSGAGPWDAGCG